MIQYKIRTKHSQPLTRWGSYVKMRETGSVPPLILRQQDCFTLSPEIMCILQASIITAQTHFTCEKEFLISHVFLQISMPPKLRNCQAPVALPSICLLSNSSIAQLAHMHHPFDTAVTTLHIHSWLHLCTGATCAMLYRASLTKLHCHCCMHMLTVLYV